MTPHPMSAPKGWAPPGVTPRTIRGVAPLGGLCQVLAVTQVENGWKVDYLELNPSSDTDLTTGSNGRPNAKPVAAPNADRAAALIPSAISEAAPKVGDLIHIFDAPASDYKWAILVPDIQKTADDAVAGIVSPDGWGSILGMGPADCVEFSSPGGQGRCSNVLQFKIKGTWANGAWTAGAPLAEAAGGITLVFEVAGDVPTLTGYFAGGSVDPVEFKLVTVGSHCAIFVTLDRRICTNPPGGPCETNALVVSVCCVPCWDGLEQWCGVPLVEAHFPRSLVSIYTGETYDACGAGCVDTGGTTLCCSNMFDFALAWNADHTAIIAAIAWNIGTPAHTTSYEVVNVISWLPFHATITLTAPTCTSGAAGQVIELWQVNGTEPSSLTHGCEFIGPRPQVECADCPGGAAPQAWTTNVCCTMQGVPGNPFPTMSYDGDCVWTSPGGFTVTIGNGKIKLTYPGGTSPANTPTYEADIPENCCDPVVLTRTVPEDPTDLSLYLERGCVPLFPDFDVDPVWPDTITLIPYGECEGPGGGEPCGVEGCEGGAANAYSVPFSGGSGEFGEIAGDWTFTWNGSAWTASQGGWTGVYVPGNTGVLTLTKDSDPGVYIVIAFLFQVGCCGTSFGYYFVDYTATGSFIDPATMSSVGDCDCPA